VFVINKEESLRGTVTIAPSKRMGVGQAVLLRAPAVESKTDTTLGGQSVDLTTGEIAAPTTQRVAPDATGAYTVELDVADVVMLSVEAGG
jgi:hypothetical protein